MSTPPQPPPSVAFAYLGVRRALRRALDRMLPSDLLIFESSMALAGTHVLGTFAELRVAEALRDHPGRSAHAAALAEVVGADPDALHRLLRAAHAAGVVRMASRTGRCRLTRRGRVLLADHPRSQRDWCIYLASGPTTRAWAGLTEAVRSGESAFAVVHGRSVWDHFAAHPDEERVFAGAMARLTRAAAPGLAAAYPWPAGATVCDVAGGIGTLLGAVLVRDPSLRGVLVDGPGVLRAADGNLKRLGVRERIDLVPGDIFTQVDARADVYLLKDVLHDWDDARCARILAGVRAAADPGARCVLLETLQDPHRPHPFAAYEDLQMLTQCDGGRQRSVAELHALLDAAGFVPGDVRRTVSHALVEGIAR